MCITDFTLGNISRRRLRHRIRFRLSLALNTTPIACFLKMKCAKNTKHLYIAARRVQHIRSLSFNVNIFSKEQSLRDFRFRPSEISKVSSIVQYYQERSTRLGYRSNPIFATCILLRRLASSCRWHDLEILFGCRYYIMSEIFWEALESLIESYSHLLESFRYDLMYERAETYATAVAEQGSPIDSCVGFIDCTKIQIQRPGGQNINQRAVYFGYKRFHILIYQSITTPDGLIFHMYGLEAGRRHNITLYRQSGMDDILLDALYINDRPVYVYGDPAYMLRPWLQVAFNRAFATAPQLAHNTAMSSVREAVEWSYKDLKQMWTSQAYSRMLKVKKVPVVLMYKGAALLWNVKVCMWHGGETNLFFKVKPPTLARYLQFEE